MHRAALTFPLACIVLSMATLITALPVPSAAEPELARRQFPQAAGMPGSPSFLGRFESKVKAKAQDVLANPELIDSSQMQARQHSLPGHLMLTTQGDRLQLTSDRGGINISGRVGNKIGALWHPMATARNFVGGMISKPYNNERQISMLQDYGYGN